MGRPTIGNKAVENADALAGLQFVLKQSRLNKFHDGNSDITEKELGDILDCYHPEANTIDASDAKAAPIISGLSEKQFTALAREYQVRFPQGHKNVDASLWREREREITPSRSALLPTKTTIETHPNNTRGTWKPDELLNPEVTGLIGTKKELTRGNFRISYDAEYRVLRVRNVVNRDLAFNIWFDEKGVVKVIGRYDVSDRGMFVQTVLDLEREGIFLPGTAKKLGIGADDVERAQKSQELFARLAQVNHSNVNELPSSLKYTGARTIGVLQGDARFIDPNGNVDGLYTTGAGPCAILVVVIKDRQTGRALKSGMAHADGIGEESLRTFFERLTSGQSDYNIEVHVLSGERGIASKILKVSLDAKADIKFFDADLDGHRSDAAIIGKDGKIYYGHRDDFNALFNPRETDLLQFTRPGNNELIFK